MEKVKEKDTVSVHYTGTLSDGEVFDSSVNREPLSFTVGAGQMIPGFDNAVVGMEVKEKKSVTIPASEAYGDVRPDMVQKISKDQLPPDLNPQVGQQLASQLPSGEQIIVTVADIADEEITIDANHPLAGKDLTFEIEVLEIS
ncbi:MAG TPA: peptidylprolyl isomerase [Cryomorphaceae bacterium]|nr:peptidylprolyl isomerase [Cryomorphaceae bacterium]